MKNNLVIVGGGTAGWLTALYAKKIFPEENIILIESEKIGILGAGEASTPHIIDILDFLEIPTSEIVKNTGATIKSTAKFTNWSNIENDYFYHPFAYFVNDASEFNGYFETFVINTNLYHLFAYSKNKSMSDYCLINKLCDNNLVPFIKNEKENVRNNIFKYDQIGDWSLNFDASMLAKYLRSIAESRGVKRIEGTVQDASLSDNGNIEKIILSDDQVVEADFVFDCTGFARFFIGKKYGSKWISYKEYLPTNKALPFFLDLENDKQIPPYIEATAMDYGWMWKTPLQHRYGCGYVFDDSHISIDQAKVEVENRLGFEVDVPKIFSFEPGCYEEIWINNCVAIGLAAGFLEPLEATSLYQTIKTLKYFFANKNNILTNNESIKNKFNEIYREESFSIVEYIYWHYVTNKDNTVFWKDFTKNNKTPELISSILEITKERAPDFTDFFYKSTMFNMDDFLYVLYGHKIMPKEVVDLYENDLKNFEEKYKVLIENQNILTSLAVDHNTFLNHLKE